MTLPQNRPGRSSGNSDNFSFVRRCGCDLGRLGADDKSQGRLLHRQRLQCLASIPGIKVSRQQARMRRNRGAIRFPFRPTQYLINLCGGMEKTRARRHARYAARVHMRLPVECFTRLIALFRRASVHDCPTRLRIFVMDDHH